MSKKVVIVSGATGKIGFAIARNIAKNPDYQVSLVGRNEAALIEACNEIISTTGNKDTDYRCVDLSLMKEIQQMRDEWERPLHVLINNAATCPRSRMENAEGVEMQFASNVLGYYRMIKAFEPILRKSAPARIVNVASYWAGNLDMDDLEFNKRGYDNNTAYRQSKQADRMLSAYFSILLEKDGITVNACHPGDVNSKLSNSLGFGGHESPDQGAATPVWLATSNEVEGTSGKYFEHLRQQHCHYGADMEACKMLADQCAKY